MAKFQPDRRSDARFDRMQRVKMVVAAAVILLCVSWLGYFMLGNKPVDRIDPTTPVQRFHLAVVSVFENERFERVSLIDSGDGKSMTISGNVRSQAELDELKKGLDDAAAKVAAQGAPIELKWDVKIK